MIRNYLLTALRNLWRSKAFSGLNLTGLAVGMASATLILLVIHNEVTFDDFHHNKATLYKVWNRDIVNGSLFCWDGTPQPLGPDLIHEYPAIRYPVSCHRRRAARPSPPPAPTPPVR